MNSDLMMLLVAVFESLDLILYKTELTNEKKMELKDSFKKLVISKYAGLKEGEMRNFITNAEAIIKNSTPSVKKEDMND